MWLVLCVWVAVAILASGSSAVVAKPCRPAYWNTRNGVVHTACQPRNRNCTILLRGLSNREKKDFLRRHNKLRSLIAMGRLKGFKPAANMYELVWDDELAEVAQALADQCGDMMHDNANGRFTRRFRVTGQNLASERRSNDVRKMDGLRFVDTWFKEHRDYPPHQVKHFMPSFGPRPTGHFTQMIWADTQYLGCGFTMFRMKGDIGVMPYQKHYVCNYADSGNIKGRPVYTEGPTCSLCPVGSRCVKRTGLCRARKRSRRVRGRQRSQAGSRPRNSGLAARRMWQQHTDKCAAKGGRKC
ncbi:CRISP/Allergen/PR-1 [Rhipicephalus sanguineus]|uniref:CRISP/Allergen/PR-1 n=1 Tax=Rhipicephalus sanguineus TaxID=34632 RepID=UPI001893D7BF|nr:CRISP/Allergen/PR-1 [Rhipicephalus sanguineus]